MEESSKRIPDFQSIVFPLLALLNDGQPHGTVDLTNHVGDQFQLTDGQRIERLPSGSKSASFSSTAPELANMLIEHNVGVAVAAAYQIKRIDSDYFNEE